MASASTAELKTRANVDQNDSQVGRMKVEFASNNPNLKQALEIYQDIDVLNSDTHKNNHSNSKYKVQTTPNVPPVQPKPTGIQKKAARNPKDFKFSRP